MANIVWTDMRENNSDAAKQHKKFLAGKAT
jgi:hypothetical protein